MVMVFSSFGNKKKAHPVIGMSRAYEVFGLLTDSQITDIMADS